MNHYLNNSSQLECHLNQRSNYWGRRKHHLSVPEEMIFRYFARMRRYSQTVTKNYRKWPVMKNSHMTWANMSQLNSMQRPCFECTHHVYTANSHSPQRHNPAHRATWEIRSKELLHLAAVFDASQKAFVVLMPLITRLMIIQRGSSTKQYFRIDLSRFKSTIGDNCNMSMNLIDDSVQQRSKVEPIICLFDMKRQMDTVSYKSRSFVKYWFNFNSSFAQDSLLEIHSTKH